MNKFDRIISVLILLQTKKIITAAIIAKRFETSLRTVYRDINTLKNAGIPITGDPGIGYSIMEGYRSFPIDMNEICVYTVADGKIIKEEFFYTPPPSQAA